MRSHPFITAVCVVLTAACAPTAPITIVRLGRKPPTRGDSGDRIEVRRSSPDTYAGLSSGAYVVRDMADWERMWRGRAATHESAGPDAPTEKASPTEEATDLPDPPSTLESKDMLVVVSNQDPAIAQVKITDVFETGGLVNVWVRQTSVGEGCVRRPDDPASVDAVMTTRIEKPLKFFIEDVDGTSCGEPPKANVACRVAKGGPASAQNMTAKSGDVVECELSSTARGTYELVDQMLTLTELPPGSNAKLKFTSSSGLRATFALDTYGTYAVRAEATDEAGRKGRATALIEVSPKKTRDVLLQLSWADVDKGDPRAPAPRVMLRVTQDGPRGQRCSAEVPVPGLCDAKTRGDYTYMRIPASQRKLPVSLLYLDERAQEGPAPCVNVWFNGERTATICDRDHRHAEDRWEIGILETGSGKVLPPKPPEPPKPAPAKSAAPAAKPPPSASAPAAKSPPSAPAASAKPSSTPAASAAKPAASTK